MRRIISAEDVLLRAQDVQVFKGGAGSPESRGLSTTPLDLDLWAARTKVMPGGRGGESSFVVRRRRHFGAAAVGGGGQG